jgi:hypothetical protein
MSKTNSNNRRGQTIQVKVKPQLVGLTKESKLDLENDKRLPEAFTINVVSVNKTKTYVFHHPIGITDLDGKSWVCTPVEDVHQLLARSDDPKQQEVNKLRSKVRTEILVGKGLLIKDNEKVLYPIAVHEERVDRNAILNLADDKLKNDKAAFRLQKQSENEKATRAEIDAIVKAQYQKDRFDFLTESIRAYEIKLQDISEEIRQLVEEAVPQTYRTRWGPLAEYQQVECPVLRNIKTKAEAEDEVNKFLHRQLVFPKEDKPGVQSSAAANSPTKAGGLDTSQDILAQIGKDPVKKSILDAVFDGFKTGKKPQKKEGKGKPSPPSPANVSLTESNKQ